MLLSHFGLGYVGGGCGFNFTFLYMSILSACMYYINNVCACYPWRSEECIGSPETGVVIVTGYHVGDGSEPGSYKSNQCSYPLSHVVLFNVDISAFHC